jgi:hypothetical protein
MKVDLDKQWWVVPIIAGVVGLIALLMAYSVLPGLELVAVLLLLILVGVSFLWAFIQRSVWWAVAPGVWALTAVVAVLVNYYLPWNNGWIATLILGAGTFVIAAIPNHRVEINVAHFCGIVLILFGFVISPMRILWKTVLILTSLLLAVYFAWLDREDMKRLLAS